MAGVHVRAINANASVWECISNVFKRRIGKVVQKRLWCADWMGTAQVDKLQAWMLSKPQQKNSTMVQVTMDLASALCVTPSQKRSHGNRKQRGRIGRYHTRQTKDNVHNKGNESRCSKQRQKIKNSRPGKLI